MNPFQKQLLMNDGRTLYEHAKDVVDGSLDCSNLDMGAPAPTPQRVSVEEFLADMAQRKRRPV